MVCCDTSDSPPKGLPQSEDITDEDLEMIEALGIHSAQGYGIARPEPLAESVHTLHRLARKSNRRQNEALSERF